MLDGFETREVTLEGVTRTVHRRGDGPGVLVMHEIPGITPQVAQFGRIVADAGFTVEMPELFGVLNKPISGGYVAGQMLRACISREFHVLAAHGASPITDWLRALARALHEEIGGKGIGAIGMCLTGNFALALMMEPALMAPVLSQPSLPFGFGKERRAALHVTPEQLACVKKRAAEGAGVLGLRFTHDPLCPPERFETLRRELGDGFEGIEIDSGRGNAHGISRIAHSVVAADFVDETGHPTREAMDRVLGLFAERL
ncbi:MAG: dienelactone hydrolase [bacterium]|nr:dienelactone hydrolase [bacterium]